MNAIEGIFERKMINMKVIENMTSFWMNKEKHERNIRHDSHIFECIKKNMNAIEKHVGNIWRKTCVLYLIVESRVYRIQSSPWVCHELNVCHSWEDPRREEQSSSERKKILRSISFWPKSTKTGVWNANGQFITVNY